MPPKKPTHGGPRKGAGSGCWVAREKAVHDSMLAALEKAHSWIGGMSFTPACEGEAEQLMADLEAAITNAKRGA
jgi:hypothetical protein